MALVGGCRADLYRLTALDIYGTAGEEVKEDRGLIHVHDHLVVEFVGLILALYKVMEAGDFFQVTW